MKTFLSIFFALLAITSVSAGVHLTTGWNPYAVFGVTTALSFMPSGVEGSAAFMALNKEIWLNEIKEGFYADDMWISNSRDLSPFVENDKIHLAEAGVNPDVLINNTTYPIAVSQRADTDNELVLDTFDTENTLIRSIETAELSYDKRSSVIYGHKQALRMSIMQKGAHAIAPAADSTFTPLLAATGTTNGNGRKKITFADMRKMRRRFDDAEIPAEGRCVILSTEHHEDLDNEDKVLYNQMMGKNEIYGFKVYSLAASRMPVYNKDTGAKVAYGAAAAPTTDTHCSIFWQKDEVGRALGSQDMFAREKDPTERGDILGFQQRALVIPLRGKGVGAIYSATV